MRTEQITRTLRALTRAVRSNDALWYFGYCAYFVFHAVSLCTTTYGIGVVMQAERIGWVVSFLLSLAVQTMIGVSGHRLQQAWRRRWRVATASFAVLLICVSISIGFAYAFWWHLLRSDSVARDVAVAQNDRITRPLQAFTHHLSVAANSLDRLAAYSAEHAATERSAGGTCEAVGHGAGPRTRLRQADDRTFGSLAERFRDTTANAETAVGELQKLRNTYDPISHDEHEAAVNRIMQRLRPLVTTSYEPTITQLESRIARGRGELMDDLTGERFRCRDSHLEDFLRQAIGTLRQLQDVRNEVPAELGFHRPDHQESLAVAYGHLVTRLGFRSADLQSPAREAGDLVPLLFALTVDFVIFVLPFLFPENDGGDDDGDRRDFVSEINEATKPDPRADGVVIRRVLSFAFKDDESRNPYDLFDGFRIERRHCDEIVLPFEPETRESKAVRRVLQVLGRRPHARRRPLKPLLRRELRRDLGTEFVTVYRLEPEFMVTLAQERVRQSAATAEESAPAEDASPAQERVRQSAGPSEDACSPRGVFVVAS